MPPQGKDQSSIEGLKKMLGDIAVMATMPDADPRFFTQLQQMISGYIRSKAQSTIQPGMGQPPQGPPPGPGGMPGSPPPGMPPRPPMGLGGGQPGLSQTGGISAPGGPPPGMPNPDELRRILGGGQAG